MNLKKQVDNISGTIKRILFSNAQTGYAVFVVTIPQGHEVTLKGNFPAVQPGETITAHGSWINHPKFGKQFEATSCCVQQPTSIDGLKKYLGSGLIKGIGPVYAEKLVSYFGQDVLTIIDTSPHRLHEVPGIGEKRLEQIIVAWQDQKEISHIMLFLQDKGISTTYAVKIYKAYKNRAIEIISQNPYKISEDIWGIGFKIADRIAQQIGIALDSLKRFRAGILHIITIHLSNGHGYIELDELRKKTADLLEVTNEDAQDKIKSALHDLHYEEKIKLISYKNSHYLTLPQLYGSEKGIAIKIKELLKMPPTTVLTNEMITNWGKNQSTSIELTQDQKAAIHCCLSNKVAIITGGPGTGKTTIVKELLSFFTSHKISFQLAAPTGRAAKRLAESTRGSAVTIHRFLEFDPSVMKFTKDEQNPASIELLLLDETSMVDIYLMYAVLKALPSCARLILIGDSNQLPSVGAGNVLQDLIASNNVATTHLSTIFRQAQNSMIITNAHRINNGEFPLLTPQEHSIPDFLFIQQEDTASINDHLDHIYRHILPKHSIPIDESIILSPMNRGVGGTQMLNHYMQSLLNPQYKKNSVIHGMYTFGINDRVMQIKNNYEKMVFNGDTGTIQAIDQVNQIVDVLYQDTIISYSTHELDELTLAYAISIHKSQGSEYQAVIIVVTMNHFMLLQRNLIYTAITRAKKLCIIIGQTKALAIAIKNVSGKERITFLREYIKSDLQCR